MPFVFKTKDSEFKVLCLTGLIPIYLLAKDLIRNIQDKQYFSEDSVICE